LPIFECKLGNIFFKELKTPIKIVWDGEVSGLMQSGLYYSMKKIPDDPKYPYFSAILKSPSEEILSGKYRVYGNLIGVECGSYISVFGWQSRPEVEVDKIEAIQ